MDEKVREAITVPVVQAVREAARDPRNSMTLQEAAPVASAVLDHMTPVIAHMTNNEPWYQSRVTWGVIISVAAPILSALGVSADLLDPDIAVSISSAVVTVIGGAVTLYGRWRARKPLLSGG